MKTNREDMVGRGSLGVEEMLARKKRLYGVEIPAWGQMSVEKREEIIQILAGMLVRQVERQQEGSHEQSS